jgi:hypothetical protein
MTTNDELSALQPASFRGFRFPVTSRTHTEGTDKIVTSIVYRNGVYVQILARAGREFTYQVPMRSGINTSGYKRLFAQVPEFFETYRNTEPGELVDPVFGPILAAPGSWTDELTAMLRDGVDVSISFTEHVPIGEVVDSKPPTLQSIELDNVALDAIVTATPWTLQTTPETEGTDPLSAAAGLMNQVSYTKDTLNAHILAVGSKAGRVERAAEKLGIAGDPARMAARKLRLDCERTANAPPREKFGTVVQIVQEAPQTISQLAMASGMTVEELLRSDANMARNIISPPRRRVWTKPRPRAV